MNFAAPASHSAKAVTLAPVSILMKPSEPASTPTASKPTKNRQTADEAHIVIVGRDDRGKAHASWFPKHLADAANSAAERMCMHGVAVTATNRVLADALPQGKLFESGLAFVPFVKREVFEALIAGIPAGERDRVEGARIAAAAVKAAQRASEETEGEAQPYEPILPGNLPTDWPKIKVSSVVLASNGPEEGWWEALVLESKDDDLFVVRWRDDPHSDLVLRKRDQLALLPQGYRGK